MKLAPFLLSLALTLPVLSLPLPGPGAPPGLAAPASRLEKPLKWVGFGREAPGVANLYRQMSPESKLKTVWGGIWGGKRGVYHQCGKVCKKEADAMIAKNNGVLSRSDLRVYAGHLKEWKHFERKTKERPTEGLGDI